jgi:hypothetical protein
MGDGRDHLLPSCWLVDLFHSIVLFSDFPLTGYTPFDRDTQQQEMQAIIAGDYKFEPRARSDLLPSQYPTDQMIGFL